MTKIQKILSLLTIGIWVLYCIPSLLWLTETLYRQYTLVNSILLISITLGLIWKVKKDYTILREHRPSWTLQGFPLLLWVASAICYLIISLTLNFNILKCIFFLSGSYALLSQFIPYATWRKGFIPIILIILTLPFGSQLDIYLGFPLRLISAQWVMQGLQAFGIHGLSDATIITIENQSAEVSASCSGLNGLWTGWLFFFFISWLENYSKNIKWILAFILLNVLLLSFNTSRIFILVLLETVMQQHEAANTLHIPMGLIGFISSCILTWLFLKSNIAQQSSALSYTLPSPQVHQLKTQFSYSVVLQFMLISLLLPMDYLANAREPQVSAQASSMVIQLDPSISMNTCELTAGEKIIFKKEQSTCYKFRFTSGELSGSCLLVRSSDWHGHHPPDLCLQGNGFKIEKPETKMAEKDFPIHLLDLKDTEQTSCYWFQSPDFITQDHAERVWTEVRGAERNWIMVSILFDADPQQHNKDFKNILTQIRKAVQHKL